MKFQNMQILMITPPTFCELLDVGSLFHILFPYSTRLTDSYVWNFFTYMCSFSFFSLDTWKSYILMAV